MTKGEFIQWWDDLKLGITPHQQRHAYVTELYEAGIPAEVAMTQQATPISKLCAESTHISGTVRQPRPGSCWTPSIIRM